jgi:hypothetical protein
MSHSEAVTTGHVRSTFSVLRAGSERSTKNPDARDRPVARLDAPAAFVAWAGVCALVLIAPFEAAQPILRAPGQALSTVETALGFVFLVWFAASVWSRETPVWRTPLTWPWLAFLSAMLVAALAGVDRTNGLHMLGRYSLAFGVYLIAVNGVTTFGRLRGVLVAAAVAGALVATIVIFEYLNVGLVVHALTLFRPWTAVLGAQVRAGGPFQYPTIASMYLEIVFALTLGLLLLVIDADRRHPTRRYRVAIVALIATALLMSEAVTLTFTRSGLITMAASLAIIGLLRLWLSRFDLGTKVLLALTAAVALQVLTSRSFESLRLRMTTEGQDQWYSASVTAPLELAIRTGARTTVPITLTNTGLSAWDSHGVVPFHVSYHWLLPNEDRIVAWEGLRTDFPVPVLRGESASISAHVEAPGQPGEYRLLWDIEQEHRLWFSTEPEAELFVSRATVSGAAMGALETNFLPLPRRAVRPGRWVLWRAAARILAAHPVLGVGPDNYRLLYGRFAGLANADQRVHSNNMYLEIFVGGGLLGAVAFVWFCWNAALRFAHPVLRPVDLRIATVAAAVSAAGAAIALHGIVDSFLGFTGTYTLIAITLGLAVAADHLNEADAHRV